MARRRRLYLVLVFLTAVGVTPPAAASASPAPEANLLSATQVSMGFDHACAVLSSGQVRCWGANASGQLGDGDFDPTSGFAVAVRNPTDTGRLTGARQVAAGLTHTCALLSSRQVACWGGNAAGQLGNGPGGDVALPAIVRNGANTGPLQNVTQISINAVGTHTCARLTSGQLRCWGQNDSGQLGDGTDAPRPRPVAVRAVSGAGALTDVAEVAAGSTHTCARLTNGQARCWGTNGGGKLGDGTLDFGPRLRPVIVRATTGSRALTGVLGLAAGQSHTCARISGNRARCWGYGGNGELGDSTATAGTPRPQPVLSPGGDADLEGVVALALGSFASCARLSSGQLRCWGANTTGAVGNGATDTRYLPTAVLNVSGTAPLQNATSVSTSGEAACATLANGQVRCWGANTDRQLGDGTDEQRLLPVAVRLS